MRIDLTQPKNALHLTASPKWPRSACRRILVSDYSGHPFQVQLSRALAGRGHTVLHVSSGSFQTPKGPLARKDGDPPSFQSVAVCSQQPFAKYSFIKRLRQEIEVGRLIGDQIRQFSPDVVISSNAPLDTQKQIQEAARLKAAPFVFWIQDVYSDAISRILRKKFGFLGRIVGAVYQQLEGRLLARSDHIVAISDDFVPAVLALADVHPSRISVVENWAPLDDLPLYSRDNLWARTNLPASDCRLIYCGTLGLKHNPQLLVDLARSVDADVLVFSEGPAAEKLRQQGMTLGLQNLHVSSWLPFESLPQALAGGDVLVVILEPDAGAFAVPSKVLSYMCAGRAILGAVPRANLAARIIEDNHAGAVVDPTDTAGFVAAAKRLVEAPTERRAMGDAARKYAEHTFDIDSISQRFERMFENLIRNKEQSNA